MRRLLIVILIAALGWFAYWFVISNIAQTGYEAWFKDRQDEGWQAEYSNLQLRGFPNRIDTTFENITLADPDTGLAWTAPFFQIFALSYRPNHLIAVWPKSQTLSTPIQDIAITNDDMKASVVFAANTNVALRRANFATTDLQLSSDAEWSLSADNLRVAISQDETTDTRYQVALQGQGVAPPSSLRNDVLPEKMSALDLDASLEFDRVWDLRALQERRPQPTAIALRTAKAQWGPMLFQAAGDFTLDELGTLNGELTLRAKEWQSMIQIARESQTIDPFVIDGAEQLMRLFSSLSGPGQDIDLKLTFKNGSTYAGFLPLGSAPRLSLR
ncbi:MAG: DUF2125 domain-containing protein [Cognatishimia sp.]|uniref:DUF2125 domain-containing protein n=1 Tax=Cognatishimia sp. TaxID=2211648 RepID=UPI003B8C85A8